MPFESERSSATTGSEPGVITTTGPSLRTAEGRVEPGTNERRLPAPRCADHGDEAVVEQPIEQRGDDALPPEEEVAILRAEGHQAAVGARGRPRRDRQTGCHERPRRPILRRRGVQELGEADLGREPAVDRHGGRIVDQDLSRTGQRQETYRSGNRLSPIAPGARFHVSGDGSYARIERVREAASRFEAVPGGRERHQQRPVVGRCETVAPMRVSDLEHGSFRALRGDGRYVGQHERDGPAGKVGSPPAPQSRDQLARRRIAARRVGGEVRSHDALQRRDALGLDPHQLGGPPEGGSPASSATAVAANEYTSEAGSVSLRRLPQAPRSRRSLPGGGRRRASRRGRSRRERSGPRTSGSGWPASRRHARREGRACAGDPAPRRPARGSESRAEGRVHDHPRRRATPRGRGPRSSPSR